jgi:hypothetical protein
LATTDARVHYAVLKIRAVPATRSPRAPTRRTGPEMGSGVPPGGAVRREVGPDRITSAPPNEHPSSGSTSPAGLSRGVPGGLPPGLALRVALAKVASRPPGSLSRLGRNTP